jgi:hypothetical protein
MKKFKIEVIQYLEGNFRGHLEIEAENEEQLKIKLANLEEDEIDDLVYDWETENFVGFGKYNFENIREI